MSKLARKPPVAFFGFNRPDCTEKTFAAIRAFQPDLLFLIADGPRPDVADDQTRCLAVREILQKIDWPCEVRRNYSDENLGCKKRMSSGLDWVFSQVEEAIIFEDDCVPCPDFFVFCAEMLARYRSESSVMHIGGHNFQDGRQRGDASYYFSRYLHVWGWATWRRAWQGYDVNMAGWPQAKKDGLLEKAGMDSIERGYWTKMFDRTHAGEINTWDYQWSFACWSRQGLGITPNVNLVTNIGAGPDATHTKMAEGSLAIPTGSLGTITHPVRISRDVAADEFTFDGHYDGRKMRMNPALKLWLKWRKSIKKRLKRILPFGKRKSTPSQNLKPEISMPKATAKGYKIYICHYGKNLERLKYLDGLQIDFQLIRDFDPGEIKPAEANQPDDSRTLFEQLDRIKYVLRFNGQLALASQKNRRISPNQIYHSLQKSEDTGSWLNAVFAGLKLRPAETSLFLKHLAAWRSFGSSQSDHWALIAEDDVVFKDDSLQRLNELVAAIPGHVDYIDVGGGAGLKPEPAFGLLSPEIKGLYLIDPPASRTTCAYLINRKFAEKIASTSHPPLMPIDWYLNYLMQVHSAKVCWLEPPVFIHGSEQDYYGSNLR
jgi:GR25 family glycosyltransferase involved in LPS biosynthesis